jgi:hypothetical protein
VDFTRAFPSAPSEQVRAVQARLWEKYPPHSSTFTVDLATERVTIPCRVHLRELKEEALDPTARRVTDCLLTRDGNGYVRERYLRRLFPHNEEWVCPFVWVLLGEYVIEIVEVIRENAAALDEQMYRAFVERNPAFVELTRQRAISYFGAPNRWPRRLDRCEQYPAFEVFARFGAAGLRSRR